MAAYADRVRSGGWVAVGWEIIGAQILVPGYADVQVAVTEDGKTRTAHVFAVLEDEAWKLCGDRDQPHTEADVNRYESGRND